MGLPEFQDFLILNQNLRHQHSARVFRQAIPGVVDLFEQLSVRTLVHDYVGLADNIMHFD